VLDDEEYDESDDEACNCDDAVAAAVVSNDGDFQPFLLVSE